MFKKNVLLVLVKAITEFLFVLRQFVILMMEKLSKAQGDGITEWMCGGNG